MDNTFKHLLNASIRPPDIQMSIDLRMTDLLLDKENMFHKTFKQSTYIIGFSRFFEVYKQSKVAILEILEVILNILNTPFIHFTIRIFHKVGRDVFRMT